MTRSDYIQNLLKSCTPILPTFDVKLADGGRVAMHTDTLMQIAVRGSASEDFCSALVSKGAIVDLGSVGRGLVLLAHHVLAQHLHRSFAEEQLAFDPVLLTFLDRYDVPEEHRRRLAKRRVWVVGVRIPI